MTKTKVQIRLAKNSDLTEIQTLFVETIEAVCKNDYSPEQIEVWTSSVKNTPRWIDKLTKQYFLVAQINNQIVGFASLEKQDYLDLLYVHKDHQRKGIAAQLYQEIEARAIDRGAAIINADVSITAKPFFEQFGFEIITAQINNLKNVEIINYRMSKVLQKPPQSERILSAK